MSEAVDNRARNIKESRKNREVGSHSNCVHMNIVETLPFYFVEHLNAINGIMSM